MKNIIIVDDEAVIVNLISEHLDWNNIGIGKVYTAFTAKAARKVISNNDIDIIICDIEMPQEDGLELLRWVTEYDNTIIKIILTSYPNFEYAQEAVELGVNRYLLKPISFDELSETIKSAASKLNSDKNMFLERNKSIRREEHDFYMKLLIGEILPFSEFVDRALLDYGLSRECVSPKALVYLKLQNVFTATKNGNSDLLYALSNIAEELFPGITEIHLWDNIFWIVDSSNDSNCLSEMCSVFLDKTKSRVKGKITAYFILNIDLESLSERAKELQVAALQFKVLGQDIYDVSNLIDSMIDNTSKGDDIISNWMTIDQIKKYIHDHYSEPIGRAEIEKVIHMNSDYINRIFKNATGYSLIQYIQYYRILVSQRIIAKGNANLTEVGIEVGFDNPSYFSKVFKKWTNMTPYEYYISIEGNK